MFCKYCGKELATGGIFCKYCGSTLAVKNQAETKVTSSVAQGQQIAPNIQKLNPVAIFLGVLGGLTLLLLILFFVNIVLNEPQQGSETQNKDTGAGGSPTSTNVDTVISEKNLNRILTQSETAATVVNILCDSNDDKYEDGGGSGTIVTSDGLVLTNSHIFPQDELNLYVPDIGCLVILPDENTGKPKEMYWGKPIVFKNISDKYDLAFISIYAPYVDEDNEKLGRLPINLAAYDDTKCINTDVKLGEPVRAYGYPAISGGYSLTITEGIVSSLPGEGYIITSAKISHGNSGGLAVDSRGCMIGVPSMVSGDELESLGVIISMDVISNFIDEATRDTGRTNITVNDSGANNSYSGASPAVDVSEAPGNPIDSDGDGISDYEEKNVWHTNPNNMDTDGDGYYDKYEIETGYDPKGPGKLFPVSSYIGYPLALNTSQHDDNVNRLQGRLNIIGYDLVIDGYFGQKTYEAVIDFQRKNGLPQTGIVDKETWDKIFPSS
jgi:S1-C subfamily serine protease